MTNPGLPLNVPTNLAMVWSPLLTLAIPLAVEGRVDRRVVLEDDSLVQLHKETEKDVTAVHTLLRAQWDVGRRAHDLGRLAAKLDLDFVQEECGLPG